MKTKLIIGLGNPGENYQNTRHNIGFSVIDFLNKKLGGNFLLDKKLKAEISEVKLKGNNIILAKPCIFVNRSGEAVRNLAKKFLKFKASSKNLKIENLIIVNDDLDIPFGKVKTSFAKGSAGHKGVQSIINSLKTEKFYRVRIGTANKKLEKIRKINNKKKKIGKINKFVISQFSPREKKNLKKIIKTAGERIENLIQL